MHSQLQHHLQSSGVKKPAKAAGLQVVVLIDDTNSYARDLLRGISRYQQQSLHPWSLYIIRRRRFEPPPECLKRWGSRGVIARVDSLEVEESLKETGLPVVNVSGALKNPFFPTFVQEPFLAAKMALKCFEDRGFRHHAFVGESQQQWSLERCRHLSDLLGLRGKELSRLLIHPDDFAAEGISKLILNWLVKQPRPLAVWAGDDEMGINVINACLREGIRVPEDVAVLGVDNDISVVEICTPPLSSVILDGEGAGYKAAQTLDSWMAGHQPPSGIISALPPRGIAFRRSTDVCAVEDPHVGRALRIIQKEACRGLRVSDLVDRVPISRRQLEVRFKGLLNRTLLDEIWRVQCEHACLHLEQSDLSMIEIAERCGYEHLEHFSKVFKKVMGHPPGRHRQMHVFRTGAASAHRSRNCS